MTALTLRNVPIGACYVTADKLDGERRFTVRKRVGAEFINKHGIAVAPIKILSVRQYDENGRLRFATTSSEPTVYLGDVRAPVQDMESCGAMMCRQFADGDDLPSC